MREIELNLRHLRAFCAIARTNSISVAAGIVFLSQPAITQALAKLETRLGVGLFDRTRDGMFLTEPGAMFHARVARALDHLDQGARAASKLAGQGGRSGFADFGPLMTFSQLRALMAVAERGSFTWAARSVGVSQPSLHRAARDLEKLSGLTLFNRRSREVTLTDPAQELDHRARLAQSELRQGLAEIKAWLGRDTAQINIGTLPLARSHILPGAINAFTRERPDVRVRVFDGTYGDLLQGLRNGRIDIMIGALRDPPPVDDVVQEPLLHDRVVIVARKGHPQTGREVTLGELQSCQWVVPAPRTPTRIQWDALFTSAEMDLPEAIVETSSLILMRGILLGSDRLGMISAHQVRDEIRSGQLVLLRDDLPGSARPIGLTTRNDWHPTATQSLLMDHLRTSAEESK